MKSMKKLVLAALILLASVVGLLSMAGCKNDSVPEVPKYTVKFETEHGTAPTSITVESGTKLTAEQLKALPETVDNIFEGWYDGETKAEGGTYTVTKDVTLVAKWRDRGTVAPVNFSPAGGTKFYCDESIAVSLATTTDGATIQYHLGDQNWQDYTADTTISITGDTTITAKATKEGLKPSETTATYTVRKLEGITVTTLPARTVYSVEEEVVHKKDEKIEVTATYDDGEERTVTGTITTDTSTLTESAGIGKPVTVSYKEGDTTKEATFTIDVASYQFTETVQDVDSSYTGTMTDGTYKKFGDWPQTIKEERVEIGAGTLVRGGLTYHVGSDGNYYVEHSEKYYKVEPIVWRVLTTSYKAPEGGTAGNALLLAEKILTGGIRYYVNNNQRTIGSQTVYPNNWQYSTIRAWLNGSYEANDTQDKTYDGKGFLQTAFTADAQSLIADTSVDNTAASTTDAGSNLPQATDYACANTTDKVFLLSEKEATTSEYGFAEYNVYVGDSDGTTTSTRIRVTTDYAKATGANQSSTEGYGGWWWLRSPGDDYKNFARDIDDDGDARYYDNVFTSNVGVVPALSISLQ